MQDTSGDPFGATRNSDGQTRQDEANERRRHAVDRDGNDDGDRGDQRPSGLSRISAGGVGVNRRAPAPAPGQPASGTPNRQAAPATWPVHRPPPALPGGLSPKVDARSGTPGATPRPVLPSRPIPASMPAEATKVDARTAGLERIESMPVAPARKAPVAPIRPGSPAGVALSRASPIPSEERLRAVREARRTKMGGSAGEPGGTVREPTRTSKTVEAYKEKGDQLLRRYRRERRLPVDIDVFDPMDFAVWMLSLRVGLKPSSWRLYRQAGLMALGGFPDERAVHAVALIEGDAPAEVEMGTGEPTPNTGDDRLTSARKAKYIRYEDYQRIVAYLRTSRRSEHAEILQDWLRAGVATGLRPVEWRATEVVTVQDPAHRNGKRTYLFVLNAKATNGRANGKVRTVDISDFGDVALGCVRRMSDKGMKAFEGDRFREFQSHCAQILYQACRHVWPRRKTHYALYSARHQFIANAKGLGMTNAEVSALAGHMVDETAARNYGRQRTAWSPDKVVDRARGVMEEISSVKKRLDLWEERLALLDIVRNGVKSDEAARLAGIAEDAPVPSAFVP